jgi:integrase
MALSGRPTWRPRRPLSGVERTWIREGACAAASDADGDPRDGLRDDRTRTCGRDLRRRPNAELRTREYLTDAEVARPTEAAKDNRYGHRDATMILVAYRHGLRASELVDLRWDQIDFEQPISRSGGLRRDHQARTRSRVTNCGRCAVYSASRTPSRHSSLPRNEDRPLLRRGLPGL